MEFGNTPLIELKEIEKHFSIKAKIFAKLEKYNPSGSIKDRVAFAMIDDAIKKGLLIKGSSIIEPTSGNTGIGLAYVGKSKGYRVILTMPNNMSQERIEILKSYGAEVVLTDSSLGMKGAIQKAEELKQNIKNSVILAQFDNPNNPLVHYLTTAVEIYQQTKGNIDVLVSGVGTGGTISGIGKYLKEQNQNIQIVAVEPLNSPLLTKGKSGPHQIQGIGPNFIPRTLNLSIIDEVIDVSDEQAFKTTHLVNEIEGLGVGISSGASLFAAIELAKKKEYAHKNIVVVFPDGIDRYLSIKLD